MTGLEEWHRKFDQLEIHAASVEDICIALRQNIRIAEVVPAAVSMFEADPSGGYLYDWELLNALHSVMPQFWITHPELQRRLASVLENLDPVNLPLAVHESAEKLRKSVGATNEKN